MSYLEKDIRRRFGKAVQRWQLIAEDDHLLVAVSGGKDSMALLWLLREQMKRAPIKYRITAVHVDPGFGVDSAAQMEAYFREREYPYPHPAERHRPAGARTREPRESLFSLFPAPPQAALQSRRQDGMPEDRARSSPGRPDRDVFLNVLTGASISTMRPEAGTSSAASSRSWAALLVEEDMLRRFAGIMGWPRVELGCPTAGPRKGNDSEALGILYRSNHKIRASLPRRLQNVRQEYLL